MHIYALDVKLTQAVWTSIFIYSLLVFLCSQCNLRSSKNPLKVNHFSPVQLCLPHFTSPSFHSLFVQISLCHCLCLLFLYPLPPLRFCWWIRKFRSSVHRMPNTVMCKLPHHRLRAPLEKHNQSKYLSLSILIKSFNWVETMSAH